MFPYANSAALEINNKGQELLHDERCTSQLPVLKQGII